MKEHSSMKLKYIDTFNVTETEFEKIQLLPRIVLIDNRLRSCNLKFYIDKSKANEANDRPFIQNENH